MDIELSEYLNFYPFIPNTDICRVLLETDTSSDNFAVILEIEYFRNKLGKGEILNVLNWFDKAHENVKKVFESCITNKLREIFNKEVKG